MAPALESYNRKVDILGNENFSFLIIYTMTYIIFTVLVFLKSLYNMVKTLRTDIYYVTILILNHRSDWKFIFSI